MSSIKGEGTTPANESNKNLLDSIVTKIGSTTSIVVAGTVYVVLCYKRDALLVSFFLGAIGNAIFGKILKKVLNIQRPDVDDPSQVPAIDQPSDNGMPSSHAMSLGFIGTFTALCLPITTLPLIIYAAISLRYRIKVNLHTFDQIAVGGILGTLDGFLWWQLCCNPDNFALFGGSIDIPSLVTSTGILNKQGLLPWQYLVGCSAVGVAVVGSVERRLKFLVGRVKKSE